MKRRDFIAKGGIIGAGVVGVAALSAVKRKKKLLHRRWLPIVWKLPWCQHGRVIFQALVQARSVLRNAFPTYPDGRIQVTYYAAGERVGAFDSLTKLPLATRRPITLLITTGRASIQAGRISLLCLLV